MKRPGLFLIFIVLVAGSLWMLANMVFWPKHPANKTEPVPVVASETAKPSIEIKKDTENKPGGEAKEGTEAKKGTEDKKVNVVELVDKKNLVRVTAVNGLETAGKITVVGKDPSAKGSHSAQLEKGASLAPFFLCSGPYTVESVLVEADGKSKKSETAKTLESGKEYQIRIKSDLSIEWVDPVK